MQIHLSEHIFTDSSNYFISFLSDRFESLNGEWAKELEKKFGKKFKPIFILPERHNKLFEEENYIVINELHDEIAKKWHDDKFIYLIYPEDLNKQFSESKEIVELLNKLVQKQGQVFILSFTSVWLSINNQDVLILGPDPKVAGKFDDKIEHIHTFEKLGLPVNNSNLYPNFEELRANINTFPFFISATYSSGGIESKIIDSAKDLEDFYEKLRPLNKKGSFIAADLLTDITLCPNTSALVYGEDKTELICISDQVLRENRYMGNIYPTQAKAEHIKLMQEATIKVGNYLSRQGFKGLFGLDFIITKKGDCFATDLNPRRQGGYFCNALMSKKVSLIELELKLALGQDLPEFTYQDFQVDYSWAHSKLTPYSPNMEIIEDFERGKPQEPFNEVGSTYEAIYYPKGYLLMSGNPGFYLVSGNSREIVRAMLSEETEKIIRRTFANNSIA